MARIPLVALSLLACAHVPPPADGATRLVTYNIRAGDYGLDDVTETLVELNADVIGLQEVDYQTRRSGRVDQARKLAEALNMKVAFRGHFAFQGGQFGLALLSPHRIDGVQRLSVPRSNLIVLKARVHLPSGPVPLVVVHFHALNPFDDDRMLRANEAAQLREAEVAVRAASAQGAIVMGDMNARPGSATYELFAKRFEDACDGVWYGKTWPSALPVVRIDYIWLSEGYQVDSCFAHRSVASDHRPVVADVRTAATEQLDGRPAE